MPEINFFWDPLSDNILQERDESGAVTAEYTAETGLYGNIISQNRGGVESQFHYDAQGSTLAVTDDNQNVTDTFAYTAFGEVTERTGTTTVPFQYIGQKGYYTDGLMGQMLVRRRTFEPVIARWLSVDPRGITLLDTNLFVYVRNLAVVTIDPSGLAPSSPNVRKAEVSCLGCGNYDVQWWIEPSAFTVNVYVQVLCFTFKVETCREVPDCSGKSCIPTATQAGSCCVVEWIGEGGPPIGSVPAAEDRWAYSSKVGSKCAGKGMIAHNAFIFGFPKDSESAARIAGWRQWINRPAGGSNIFKCGGVAFHVGKYFPMPTSLPKKLKDDNEEMAERGTYFAGSKFDCCPVPDSGFRGILLLTIGGGIEGGETGYECGQTFKPIDTE